MGVWGVGRRVLGGGSVSGRLFFHGCWCSSLRCSEMALFRGTWGRLGRWGMVWVYSGGSRCVLHHFWAAASGPEWGTAGDGAVIVGYIVDDVAVV